MKRLPVIVTFSGIIMGILTSGSVFKEFGSSPYRNSLQQVRNDTTGFLSYIKADTFNLAILKPSSGVQFYKNGIVFLSLTKNEVKMSSKYVSFGTTEAFFATPGDSSLGEHEAFSQRISFSYPCEGISFSPDFKTMYFTKIPKKERKEKIFMAKYTSDGKSEPAWVTDKLPLDFCKGDFNFSHPTITSDEKVMIFASDMEGSLGGMDLFITRKEGDTWTDPQNLGKSINTPGNEFFPFLDAENNLFFSSDGLTGLGGYDIFTCRFNGKVWDKPVNLSGRINSANDDIAFTIDKTDGRTAFFTQRQKSGNGDMQLFRVTLSKQFAGRDPLTISYIFHGAPLQRTSLLAAGTVTQSTAVKEEQAKVEKKKVTATPPAKSKRTSKQKPRETITVAMVSIPPPTEKIVSKEPNILLKPAPAAINRNTTPAVITKNTAPVSIASNVGIPSNKDGVVYRVQVMSSKISKGNFQFTVNNKSYDTFEYFYLNEYRYTIGEFSSLAPARELQNACRNDGKPLVFVVAFRNNVRSLDPALFKK
jgi:hypothetical protein